MNNVAAEALVRAAGLLEAWIKERREPEANRLDVVIDSADLVSAVSALDQNRWGYLSGVTGLDLGAELGQLEVLYHFCLGAAVLTLRVRIARTDASVPSICPIVPSASFYERELSEMLGVDVVGLPNKDRLFLPDDWPGGVYPLRKDAILDE